MNNENTELMELEETAVAWKAVYDRSSGSARGQAERALQALENLRDALGSLPELRATLGQHRAAMKALE